MHQKELHFKSIEQGISYPQLTDQGMFPWMFPGNTPKLSDRVTIVRISADN